jgi:hypothetical protein
VLRLQTEAQNADLGEIRLQLMSVDLKADVEPFSYAGDPQPAATISIAAFSPRTLMQELAVEVPPTADPDVLDKLIVDAKAKVGANAITLSDLRLVLDDTTFTGRLSVPKSADGRFELDLAGDRIDIARYMAPASEATAAADSADETVEIPVQDRGGVSGFVVGPVVLDLGVGLQDVGPDLAAPGDLHLLGLDGVAFLLPLLHDLHVELGPQHGHGRFAIAVLAALVLALHDNPGGFVGDAHRRIGLVHVLAACARGAIGVDPQVVAIDVHVVDCFGLR